jgi:hypothetical protein
MCGYTFGACGGFAVVTEKGINKKREPHSRFLLHIKEKSRAAR